MNAWPSWLTARVRGTEVRPRRSAAHSSDVNSMLKHAGLEHLPSSGGVQMPVQRKRFRIEEFRTDGATMPEMSEADVMPYHHEIMSELRAIREQMAKPTGAVAAEEPIAATAVN